MILVLGLLFSGPFHIVRFLQGQILVPYHPCDWYIYLHLPSLKLTWPLKIGGWKMSFLLGWPIFRVYVSFRGCKYTSAMVPSFLCGWVSGFQLQSLKMEKRNGLKTPWGKVW